jgi:hypothetical protein
VQNQGNLFLVPEAKSDHTYEQHEEVAILAINKVTEREINSPPFSTKLVANAKVLFVSSVYIPNRAGK